MSSRWLPISMLCCLSIAACEQMPSSSQVAAELERSVPGLHLERESHIHLGRMTTSMIKRLARWSMPDDEDAELLASIRKIDIATYRVVAMPESPPRHALLRIEKRLSAAGWQPLVLTHEESDSSWVLVRPDKSGHLRNLLVVELDDVELSIVGIDGRLDEMIALAIAEDPKGLNDLFDS